MILVYMKFSSVLSTLKNKYVCGFLIVIAISLIILGYYCYSSKGKETFLNEDDKPESKTSEVLFFSADWCPHCKRAKPIMEEVKSSFNNRTINGFTVTFIDVDCSEETTESRDKMEKYNVERFPTIIMKINDKSIEFEERPDKDKIEAFITSHINSA